MRVALAQARRGLGRTAPNPSVGCVIVKNGIILAAARTGDGGRPHAETIALAQAGVQARGADVYVTLEPCAHVGQTGSCAQALRAAGVQRVVVACIDPDPRVSGSGLAILREAGIEVVMSVLEAEALALNAGFIFKITQNRPFVTLKLAVSSDGKIAAGEGMRTQISGPLADTYKHVVRARHDAVLVGIGTVLADDPLLSTRLEGHFDVVKRIILDAKLEIPRGCALFRTAQIDPVWLVHQSEDSEKIRALAALGVRLLASDPHDVKAVLEHLAAEGITRLLIEGGARVAESFLKAGMVDECLLLKSPMVLGEGCVSALPTQDIFDLPDFTALRLQKTRVLGQDMLEIYTRGL